MNKLFAACLAVFFSVSVNAATIGLTLNFDDYPNDTSWEIALNTTGSVVASGGNYDASLANTTLEISNELNTGGYSFSIYDSYGDGLCCNEGNGSYSLTLDGLSIYSSDGQFGYGESFLFNVAPPTVDLSIVFDNFPGDISWDVTESEGATVVASGDNYDTSFANTTLDVALALGGGDYIFNMYDSYGDGLCCNEGSGGYSLSIGGNLFYTSNGQFGSFDSIAFSVVPIPAAVWLFGSALALMGLQRRRINQ